MKLYVIGCELIDIDVDDNQLTESCTGRVLEVLRDQFIAAYSRKPPWSTKSLVRTIREIEHHNVVSSGIFSEKDGDKCLREWTEHAIKTLEEGTELYMVEVTAESHSRDSNIVLVGFHHVSCDGKTRRSGKSWTVRHASCPEFGQNSQRRVFMRSNWRNATTH